MLRRIPVLTAVLAVLLSLGLGPLGSRAHAAAYCNIYPPGQVAVWNSFQQFSIGYGAGCLDSGAQYAAWSAVHPTRGPQMYGTWERGDSLTERVDLYDFTPLGRFQWQSQYGYDRNYDDILQNEPYTTIKLGSVSYIAAKRVGGYHEVTARAYHYSPSAGAVVPSGSRQGQIQWRSAGSSTWRPVAGVRVGSDGRVTIRTWSPGARYYRVSFGEQPTLWATVSQAVSAR